jgi:colicin import membrane protein
MHDDSRQVMVLDSGQDTRKVFGMFLVSALCHLVFFAVMTFMPNSFMSSHRFLAPRAISVDLVSLPAGEPAPAAPVAEPQTAPAVEPEAPPPEAVPIPTPKPDPVPVAPKPKPEKVVQSLKKKTIKKDKIKKPVVQQPTPPAAKPSQSKVSKAIESMRSKVATQEKTRAAAGAGANTGGGGGGGAAILSRIDNYKIEAALAVSQNWAYSQQLSGANDQLVTEITFRILPNGEITDIKIVTPSGNRYLDESAVRAIKKTSPLAPHPEGINRPYIEVGLRATPAGF